MPEIIPNLHPLAVHFPIALITLSAIFHSLGIALRGKPHSTHVATLAHAMLWLGAISAVVAAGLGWLAFNSVNHDEPSHAAMLVHRGWALAALGLVVVLAGIDAWRSKIDAPVKGWQAMAVFLAWGLIASTAWHGGELVYRHGLGVMSLPAPETGEGHHHDHGVSDSSAVNPADQAGQEHVHDDHDHQH